jgi:hypothetical protein
MMAADGLRECRPECHFSQKTHGFAFSQRFGILPPTGRAITRQVPRNGRKKAAPDRMAHCVREDAKVAHRFVP